MSVDDRRLEDGDDAALGTLLRDSGARPRPAAAQLARWRRHFEAELAATRRRRRTVRIGALVGACAAALGAVLLLPAWLAEAPAPPPASAAEVTSVFGGVVVRGADDVAHALDAGAPVRIGQRVEAGLYSGLGMRYRQADVRLDATTTVVFEPNGLRLVTGRLYVDTGADPASGSTLRVTTPLGTFEHAGTQFLVSVARGEVRGAVREGRIVLRQGARDLSLVAAADAARMVVVSSSGALREAAVAPNGELWAWAEASSPGMTVAGRSADEVLRWVARERGQRLVYTSDTVRQAALEARLSGSVAEPLPPSRALANIVATTRLRVTTFGGGAALTVSLSGDPDDRPRGGARSEADQDAH